jgi:hypothetical protein
VRALKELAPDLIKTDLIDARDYCPAYHRLGATDRMKVWLQLISSMAKFESDFDTDQKYKESFKDNDATNVVSRGLLQISKTSANLYGCNVVQARELETAEANLRCGVRIINSLVTKYKAIHGVQDVANAKELSNPYRGAARYWSVLRGSQKDRLIRASVSQLAVCQN